jgi:hypothetical protein
MASMQNIQRCCTGSGRSLLSLWSSPACHDLRTLLEGRLVFFVGSYHPREAMTTP